MQLRIAVKAPSSFRMLALMLPFVFLLAFTPACTFNRERPARSMAETTGGESMERVFWKNIQTANWVEIERSIASNYAGVTPSGALDRSAMLDQYRTWQLKDFAIGDLKTELNGSTIVVTYTITLNGTAGAQPLPATPQRMMTVWQQQKAGWVVIAQSVTP
jgi:hypothetical protein